MFVDSAKIYVKAGKGGNGSVSFRREKYVPNGGPDGGDGGKGGSVIFKVDPGMKTLMDFRYKKKYFAQDGEDGKKKKMFGKDATDTVLRIPPGTVIKDEESGLIIADLKEPGDSKVIVKGGKGGKGNVHYKSSVRQAPNFAESGDYGEERTIILELKLLADVGLVGFPNVGKSTLLSVVTKAKPKIANYHFTTITPNIGIVDAVPGKSFAMADIPGLIEGANEGIGLGHDFLRHVERTKLLIHVVDVSGMEGRDPIDDFEKINNEIKKYNDILGNRPQIIAANKIDILDDDEKLQEFTKEMESRGYVVFPISAAMAQGVNELMLYTTEMLDKVEVPDIVEISDEQLFTFNKEDEKPYTIEVEGNLYMVTGKRIEKLMYSTDFSDIDSLRRFQNILKKMGVFEELINLGIENGDTVRIFEYEFEYFM